MVGQDEGPGCFGILLGEWIGKQLAWLAIMRGELKDGFLPVDQLAKSWIGLGRGNREKPAGVIFAEQACAGLRSALATPWKSPERVDPNPNPGESCKEGT